MEIRNCERVCKKENLLESSLKEIEGYRKAKEAPKGSVQKKDIPEIDVSSEKERDLFGSRGKYYSIEIKWNKESMDLIIRRIENKEILWKLVSAFPEPGHLTNSEWKRIKKEGGFGPYLYEPDDKKKMRLKMTREGKKNIGRDVIINLPLLFKRFEEWIHAEVKQEVHLGAARMPSKDDRKTIWKNREHRCQITGFPLFEESEVTKHRPFLHAMYIRAFDHRVPWTKYGPSQIGVNKPENIQLLSRAANLEKKDFCGRCDFNCGPKTPRIIAETDKEIHVEVGCALAYPEHSWKIKCTESCISTIFERGKRIKRRKVMKEQCKEGLKILRDRNFSEQLSESGKTIIICE